MRDFSISKNFDFTSISNPNLDRHQDYDKNYGLRVLYLDGYLKNNDMKKRTRKYRISFLAPGL